VPSQISADLPLHTSWNVSRWYENLVLRFIVRALAASLKVHTAVCTSLLCYLGARQTGLHGLPQWKNFASDPKELHHVVWARPRYLSYRYYRLQHQTPALEEPIHRPADLLLSGTSWTCGWA
jgi:hypothetical protein